MSYTINNSPWMISQNDILQYKSDLIICILVCDTVKRSDFGRWKDFGPFIFGDKMFVGIFRSKKKLDRFVFLA